MKNVIYKRKVVSVMELEKGMMYHIRLKKGDVGRYVLLPGDPFRTDLIATYFDEPKLLHIIGSTKHGSANWTESRWRLRLLVWAVLLPPLRWKN